jgi:sortase (surface protein transpeptidase)
MRTGRLLIVMVAAVVAAAVAILLAIQVDRTEPGHSTATTAPDPTTTTKPAEFGAPVRVTIPAIGVDAALVPVGLKDDGAMQTPDFGSAAWYDRGPKPGQPGPAVVLAHVDSKAHGPDVFFRLRELKRGDQVTVHYADRDSTFAVTGSEQTAKTGLPGARIWNDAKTPVLRLITCGGAFDRKAGSYLDNVIVYADQLVA